MKGIKEVVARSGAKKKARITTILLCTGAHCKLPPVVLAKWENQVLKQSGLCRSTCFATEKSIHRHEHNAIVVVEQ